MDKHDIIIVGSGHQNLTAMCREAGYRVTEAHGARGLVVKPKKEPKPIKAMSLAQLFDLHPRDTSNDNEPQQG
ncbi:hypothetical protein D3C76_112690 [compost metagenome]